MLEIYQDTLIDLLLPKNGGKQKRLDIKKDSKVAPFLSFCFSSAFQSCLFFSLVFLLFPFLPVCLWVKSSGACVSLVP